jgi:hydrogenase nickel incorporation protein HypB
MCTTCGCGTDEVSIEGVAHSHDCHGHGHDHHHAHGHSHDHVVGNEHHQDHHHDHHDHGADGYHEHVHADGTVHRHSHAGSHSHAPGVNASRMVQIEQDILAKNDGFAARNRERLAERGIFALNLVSSPGSGKTTLLCRTISMLGGQDVAVIEGDQQTSHDAERIRATGAPAVQINTGKGCHLDANMVGRAMDQLALAEGSLLLIENVGNLVCPAAFDLGEAHKVAILSVTEGEDKPLKYPHMFRAASLMILNKTDLLPHLDFDVEAAIGYARRVNPQIRVMQLSSKTGEGMEPWLEFLRAGVRAATAAARDEVQCLRRRVAELESQLQR